ncbi:MAG: hypothetical protein ACI3X1_05445 [Eubacteriales bacterium]
MKKSIIKVFALALVAIIACLALASCAKTISGKYQGEVDVVVAKYTVTYEFKGKNVEATHKATTILGTSDTVTVKGTYEINDEGDEITFTWESEDDVVKGGTFTFEETENGIKIGVAEYKKVK